MDHKKIIIGEIDNDENIDTTYNSILYNERIMMVIIHRVNNNHYTRVVYYTLSTTTKYFC
jgi:hypothetical protein